MCPVTMSAHRSTGDTDAPDTRGPGRTGYTDAPDMQGPGRTGYTDAPDTQGPGCTGYTDTPDQTRGDPCHVRSTLSRGSSWF